VSISDTELVVANSGPVIDPDQIDSLFEPFRRLNPRQHRAGEGAGLGLAIVSSIARAHRASVAAEANPGGGLTVRVRF
jgi:signal transduction histidine kinase